MVLFHNLTERTKAIKVIGEKTGLCLYIYVMAYHGLLVSELLFLKYSYIYFNVYILFGFHLNLCKLNFHRKEVIEVEFLSKFLKKVTFGFFLNLKPNFSEARSRLEIRS